MAGLLLRRLRDVVIVLFLVGTALFFILHLIPGSPARTLLGEFATPAQVAALNSSMGLDKPLFTQYLLWLGNVVRGNLGFSFTQDQAVSTVVLTHLGPTLLLAIGGTILSVLIAVPLAVRTVQRPYSFLSRLFVGASSLGLAIPGFWLALLLILVFAVKLRWLPVAGYVSPLVSPGQAIIDLILPMIVILANLVSLLVITLREGIAGEMLNSYIRTARAKGLNENKVMYRHLLPNALLPTVTVIGSNFGALLGGIVIVETIFLIPGIGSVLNAAISARDYNVVLGLTLVSAVLIVLVNLLVDIAYVVLDPKVRVQ
jgi:peptide/nickel transport system permease protein